MGVEHLIWTEGRVVPRDSLRLDLGDPVLQHGIGLFETFRTFEGVPSLLPRHLARLARSAGELDLPLDPARLPDAAAVEQLGRSVGGGRDFRFRITLTGGGAVWMQAGPLPDEPPRAGWTLLVGRSSWPVAFEDPLARHKSLNYWGKRLALARARADGSDESLSRTPDGLFWEGSFTSLFSIRGSTLRTAPETGPILPGVMREVVLEVAGRLGWLVELEPHTSDDLAAAEEIFLTNAIRGLLSVTRVGDDPDDRPTDRTRALAEAVRRHLEWLPVASSPGSP